jgi:sec-independent protein translocase protein TatA
MVSAARPAAEEDLMVPLAFIGSLGMPELLIIFVIVVFLFGARRIPEIARGLGEGIRGFRTSLKGETPESDSTGKANEGAKNSESSS